MRTVKGVRLQGRQELIDVEIDLGEEHLWRGLRLTRVGDEDPELWRRHVAENDSV